MKIQTKNVHDIALKPLARLKDIHYVKLVDIGRKLYGICHRSILFLCIKKNLKLFSTLALLSDQAHSHS